MLVASAIFKLLSIIFVLYKDYNNIHYIHRQQVKQFVIIHIPLTHFYLKNTEHKSSL
ncbi:hypothetical protein BDF20DRAFT_859955 [Mycotypha africana]|uniref:uncharacterized protein n=1 Tax=Mycotypha africana TaxID=64632 RepID=UPI0023001620|nr:uncharacterized protein BDF20DRAFT_859955 [Mycotypha africana]KAI8984422.1 hypothetical protein BDF20DRAFT_859955 [Mycotypha africana]